MSNRSERVQRETIREVKIPAPVPAAIHMDVCHIMAAMTLPRLAPKAMRIPISCVRWLTSSATTP